MTGPRLLAARHVSSSTNHRVVRSQIRCGVACQWRSGRRVSAAVASTITNARRGARGGGGVFPPFSCSVVVSAEGTGDARAASDGGHGRRTGRLRDGRCNKREKWQHRQVTKTSTVHLLEPYLCGPVDPATKSQARQNRMRLLCISVLYYID